MIFLDSINEILESRERCGNSQVLAIDGRAGSGKTTLAGELSLVFSLDRSVTVLHMDEIYAGWQDALGSKLTRTLEDLLSSISSLQPHLLPIYDWKGEEFSASRIIEPTDLLLLEGVGSAQRIVRAYNSTTIWLDIEPKIGLARVLERDGDNILPQMQKWQLAESAHFSLDQTREYSDFILTT